MNRAALAAGAAAVFALCAWVLSSVMPDAFRFVPIGRMFEPGSPYADADGYVYYPNIDPVVEQMNAMEATRAYEANITALEATKSMFSIALQILA